MKKGKTNTHYWVKPADFFHAEQCNWCFRNIGQPDNLFLGTTGQWTINAKRGIYYFVLKEDRDHFAKVWK